MIRVKPTRRTQPLRATGKRRKNAALAAAQRGRPAYMRNPQDTRRALARRKRRLSSQWPAHPLLRVLARRRKSGR